MRAVNTKVPAISLTIARMLVEGTVGTYETELYPASSFRSKHLTSTTTSISLRRNDMTTVPFLPVGEDLNGTNPKYYPLPIPTNSWETQSHRAEH